jgi:hypothetical protein
MSRLSIAALWSSALFAAGGALAHGAAATPQHPAWVDDTLEPDGRAAIAQVTPGSPDVIVLDRGLYTGLRVGTPCLVERNGVAIADLVVVASEPGRAAALITGLAKDTTLQAGDKVRLKVIARVS